MGKDDYKTYQNKMEVNRNVSFIPTLKKSDAKVKSTLKRLYTKKINKIVSDKRSILTLQWAVSQFTKYQENNKILKGNHIKIMKIQIPLSTILLTSILASIFLVSPINHYQIGLWNCIWF